MFAVRRSPLAENDEASTANGERRTANEPDFTRLYVLVIAELIVTIIVLATFTCTFA